MRTFATEYCKCSFRFLHTALSVYAQTMRQDPWAFYQALLEPGFKAYTRGYHEVVSSAIFQAIF
jgi:hypothetical protein